jgi:hypothetical protein
LEGCAQPRGGTCAQQYSREWGWVHLAVCSLSASTTLWRWLKGVHVLDPASLLWKSVDGGFLGMMRSEGIKRNGRGGLSWQKARGGPRSPRCCACVTHMGNWRLSMWAHRARVVPQGRVWPRVKSYSRNVLPWRLTNPLPTLTLPLQTTGRPRLSAVGPRALAAAGTSRPCPGGSRTGSRRALWRSRRRSVPPKHVAVGGRASGARSAPGIGCCAWLRLHTFGETRDYINHLLQTWRLSDVAMEEGLGCSVMFRLEFVTGRSVARHDTELTHADVLKLLCYEGDRDVAWKQRARVLARLQGFSTGRRARAIGDVIYLRTQKYPKCALLRFLDQPSVAANTRRTRSHR